MSLGPIHHMMCLNRNALAIPKIDARPPHPPHRCSRKAQAELA
jgi:hypothetical protein